MWTPSWIAASVATNFSTSYSEPAGLIPRGNPPNFSMQPVQWTNSMRATLPKPGPCLACLAPPILPLRDLGP